MASFRNRPGRGLALLAFCLWFHSSLSSGDAGDSESTFWIGTGIYDITGPSAQVPFMGYAKTKQQGRGIHLRLRSRAFLMAKAVPKDMATKAAIDEVHEVERIRLQTTGTENAKSHSQSGPTSSQADPEQTVCFVSADIGMGSDLLTMKVVKRLETLIPATNGKPLCRLENLSISGTHTHSAPGGFLQYVLYQINTFGYSGETMSTYAEGIAQSIVRAYNNLQKGAISVAEGSLLDSNINRSPTSYLLNPKEERELYATEGDTDKRILQLLFTTHNDAKDLGVLNWFAVHGTSMNSSNHLISGDNKGYASYLMEKHKNGKDTLPGQGAFIAAFASTNLGDVSPNTKGPMCLDTGLPCDVISSSCEGRSEMCIASGPGDDMFESTEIIGRKQFEAAVALLGKEERKSLRGDVAYRHSFVNMANCTVYLPDGEVASTCPAALGYGFGAGTTDGPGSFDFTQGSNSSNPFWDLIASFLSPPSEEQIKCHHPKPILLNTGEATEPYRWDPNSVPISVFKVGRLFILNVPAELTTMAGRRLRKAILDTATTMGVEDPIVTIAGLSNSYTHYVTTFEEYAGQRYEAASTLFGPRTLSAYIQEFTRITTDLLRGAPSETWAPPNDLSSEQISLLPPVFVDPIEIGERFGSVVHGPKHEYTIGEDTVEVTFRSANPRNNLRIEGTYLTVEKRLEDGSWQTAHVDGDWSTRYSWREIPFLGFILAEISWKIPAEATHGIYRICHFGAAKQLFGGFEAPDWVTDCCGTSVASFLEHAVDLLASLSDKLRGRSASALCDHVTEFSGCSNSFLVKVPRYRGS